MKADKDEARLPSSSSAPVEKAAPPRSISTDDLQHGRSYGPPTPPPSPAEVRARRSSTSHIDEHVLHAASFGLPSYSASSSTYLPRQGLSGDEEGGASSSDYASSSASSGDDEGGGATMDYGASTSTPPPSRAKMRHKMSSSLRGRPDSAGEVLLARTQKGPRASPSVLHTHAPFSSPFASSLGIPPTSQVEHDRRARELAKATTHFRQKFGLREESLITCCTCSLWRGFLYRRGWMYLSENYVCFHSQFIKELVVIAFRDITLIKKESSALGLSSSIKITTKNQEYYFSTFFGMEQLFTLLEQLQQLAVERFLINTSTASLEEAKLSSNKLNQRLLRITNQGDMVNLSGSLDSTPIVPVSISSESVIRRASTFAASPFASASLSSPNLSSTTPLHSASLASTTPKTEYSITHSTPSFSFSDVQSALHAASTESQESFLSTGSFNTPRSHASPRSISSDSGSSDFEAIEEEFYHIPSGMSGDPYQTTTTKAVGGGGLDASIPILSASDLLVAKTKNEQLHSMFKIPAEEKLLLEFNGGFWWRQRWFKGRWCVTDNFLCFSYANPAYKDFILMVLSFSDVTSLTKANTKAIKIITKASTFMLGLDKRDEIFSALQKQWGHHLAKNAISGADLMNDHLAQQRGFMPWGDMVTNEENFSADYLEKQQAIFYKWETFFQTYGSSSAMVKTPALMHRVRNSIPDELRGCVWQLCSGSIYKAKAQPMYFQELIASTAEKTSLATEEIDRDVHRSFPEHPLYQTEYGLQRLKKVLAAYSWRNPDIGYCQSMNFLSSILLLYMNDEEAFWLLSTICEDIVPQYYHKAMVGSIVDQNIFEYLLQHFLPEMHKHVQSLNFSYALVTLPWFLCMYIGYLSWELTLRVLDGVFYEGPNVLFKVGLAIFALKEKEILEAKSGEDLMKILSGKLLLDVAETLKLACVRFGKLPMDKINEMKNSQKVNFLRDMQSTRQRSILRQIRDDTTFTLEEAEELYTRFKSMIPPDATYDTLDEERFARIFFEYMPSWWHKEDLLPLIFNRFDRQKQGAVGVIDFAVGVCRLCKGSIRDKFLFCLEMFDTENTGELSRTCVVEAIGTFLGLFNQTRSSRGVTFEKDRTADIIAFVDKLFFKLPVRQEKVSLVVLAEECIDRATLLTHFQLPSS